MIKRIISGAVLIGLIVGMFFIRQLNVMYFGLFIGIMAIAGTLEFMLASKKLSIAQSILTGLLPVFVFEGYIFADSLGVSFARLFAYVGAGYVFLQLAVLVLDYKHSKLDGFAFSFVCAVYPTVLLLPMMYINDFKFNSLVALIMCFVVPPCADTFAYWVGISLKGKKLCPKISPKKTISGAIGGLLGGVIGGIVLYFIAKATGILTYSLTMPGYLTFALIGLVGAILCETGDLVESVIKRQLGIKDMSNLIPGHGGILDRIDGIIYTVPFIFIVFTLI